MDETERAEAVRTREEIRALEARLAALYRSREQSIRRQSAEMTHRQIAALWGITQPRVTNMLNKDMLSARQAGRSSRSRNS